MAFLKRFLLLFFGSLGAYLLYYLLVGVFTGLFINFSSHCGGAISGLIEGFILNIIGFSLTSPIALFLIWLVGKILNRNFFYQKHLLVVLITIALVFILEELLVFQLFGKFSFPPYVPLLDCY